MMRTIPFGKIAAALMWSTAAVLLAFVILFLAIGIITFATVVTI